MADTTNLDALRRTPAQHLWEAMQAAEVTGERAVTLRELEFPLQVGLRAKPDSDSAKALEKVLGYKLPAKVGEVGGDAAASHTLWLSPDEFLQVDVSRRQAPGDADELIAALEGIPGHAVDLSANRSVFELSGPSAEAVLAKGCHSDLHPREFKVGTAITTSITSVPVLLHRVEEQTWRIYPRASFADFIARWLIDAMEEFNQSEVL